MKVRRTRQATGQAAERRGRRSELLATLILLAKGYRILGRRVRTHLGEIDLVARSPAGIVCFIEVKARDNVVAAMEAVMPRQRARIARAAEQFMAQRPGLRAKGVRFDTITVRRGLFPRHFPDAWRPQD
ncbi:MAG: YraN family protein [Rhizomicrobium sp.]|jgi:putative endonuclease